MKKLFLYILLFAGVSFAQSVTVLSVEQITTLEQGEFYYPVANYDNSKILFTSVNYRGLWTFDLQNKSLTKLNDFNSAGYEANFTEDNKIIFRKDEFINSLRFISLYEYNPTSKSQSIIEKNLRGISQIKISNGTAINYSKGDELVEIIDGKRLNKTRTNTKPVLLVENSNLIIYQNGERKILNPLGDGNYLWASVSPDGGKILFTFAGKGSYVTKLNGEIITELGFAHYPQWSNNGEWIVYMKDYDDGDKVTDSELFVSSVDGKSVYNITNTKEVYEMYPQWSKIGNEIFCNSTDGIIYKIKLELN